MKNRENIKILKSVLWWRNF